MNSRKVKKGNKLRKEGVSGEVARAAATGKGHSWSWRRDGKGSLGIHLRLVPGVQEALAGPGALWRLGRTLLLEAAMESTVVAVLRRARQAGVRDSECTRYLGLAARSEARSQLLVTLPRQLLSSRVLALGAGTGRPHLLWLLETLPPAPSAAQ